MTHEWNFCSRQPAPHLSRPINLLHMGNGYAIWSRNWHQFHILKNSHKLILCFVLHYTCAVLFRKSVWFLLFRKSGQPFDHYYYYYYHFIQISKTTNRSSILYDSDLCVAETNSIHKCVALTQHCANQRKETCLLFWMLHSNDNKNIWN